MKYVAPVVSVDEINVTDVVLASKITVDNGTGKLDEIIWSNLG